MWYACIYISDKKHRALLMSSERTIAPGGCVLVFYTHHRPQLAHGDMEFVKMAGEMRWECQKVLTVRLSGKCTPYGRSGRDFFLNSLNKSLIFIAIVVAVAMYLAYVSGGRG